MNPQRCGACRTFQPPDPRRDHFATLALPRSFDVDEALLERRLVEFGRELHPDQAGADAAQRTRAVLGAAQLNEAYGIVKEPYRRAEYLLKLEGGPTAAEDKSVPDGFLEAMLDERSSMEEALAAGSTAVTAARARFEEKQRELIDEVRRGFAALASVEPRHTPALRPRMLVALRRLLNVFAYYRGLLRDLREAARDQVQP